MVFRQMQTCCAIDKKIVSFAIASSAGRSILRYNGMAIDPRPLLRSEISEALVRIPLRARPPGFDRIG